MAGNTRLLFALYPRKVMTKGSRQEQSEVESAAQQGLSRHKPEAEPRMIYPTTHSHLLNNLPSFLPPCFLLLVLKCDVFAIYQTHCRRQSRLEQALRQANVLSHLRETVISRFHARCDHDLGVTAGSVPEMPGRLRSQSVYSRRMPKMSLSTICTDL